MPQIPNNQFVSNVNFNKNEIITEKKVNNTQLPPDLINEILTFKDHKFPDLDSLNKFQQSELKNIKLISPNWYQTSHNIFSRIMLINLSRSRDSDNNNQETHNKIQEYYKNINFNSDVTEVVKLIENSQPEEGIHLDNILESPPLEEKIPNPSLLEVTKSLLNQLPFFSESINPKSPLHVVQDEKMNLIEKFKKLPTLRSVSESNLKNNDINELVENLISFSTKYPSIYLIDEKNFDSIYSFYRIIRNDFRDNKISYDKSPKAYRDKLLCILIIASGIYDFRTNALYNTNLSDLIDEKMSPYENLEQEQWEIQESNDILYWIIDNGNLWHDESIFHFFKRLNPTFLIDYLHIIPPEQQKIIFQNKKIVLDTHKVDFENNYITNQWGTGDNNWRKLISKEICTEKLIFEFLEIDPTDYVHILSIIPEKLLKTKEFIFKLFNQIPVQNFSKFCSKDLTNKDLLNDEQLMIKVINRYPAASDFLSPSPLITNSILLITEIIKNSEIKLEFKQKTLFGILDKLKNDKNFYSEFISAGKNDNEYVTELLNTLKQDRELFDIYQQLLSQKQSEAGINSEKNNKRTFSDRGDSEISSNKRSKN